MHLNELYCFFRSLLCLQRWKLIRRLLAAPVMFLLSWQRSARLGGYMRSLVLLRSHGCVSPESQHHRLTVCVSVWVVFLCTGSVSFFILIFQSASALYLLMIPPSQDSDFDFFLLVWVAVVYHFWISGRLWGVFIPTTTFLEPMGPMIAFFFF